MLASNETASLEGQLVGSSNSVQRAIEDIQSQSILESVIGQLDLNEIWGEKYNAGVKLKSTDTMQLLKQRLEIRPVRNTRIIAITTYSEDRDEAADIANEIVKSYCLYLATNHPGLTMGRRTTFPGSPRLVEFAKPAMRPVRPNKVLNLAGGAAAGILLGAIAGGIVAGLASRSGRKASQV